MCRKILATRRHAVQTLYAITAYALVFPSTEGMPIPDADLNAFWIPTAPVTRLAFQESVEILVLDYAVKMQCVKPYPIFQCASAFLVWKETPLSSATQFEVGILGLLLEML